MPDICFVLKNQKIWQHWSQNSGMELSSSYPLQTQLDMVPPGQLRVLTLLALPHAHLNLRIPQWRDEKQEKGKTSWLRSLTAFFSPQGWPSWPSWPWSSTVIHAMTSVPFGCASYTQKKIVLIARKFKGYEKKEIIPLRMGFCVGLQAQIWK